MNKCRNITTKKQGRVRVCGPVMIDYDRDGKPLQVIQITKRQYNDYKNRMKKSRKERRRI